MDTKYGNYSSAELSSTINSIRKSIFFLLLYVDPQTKDDHKGVDVAEAFRNLQYKLDGLNSILCGNAVIVETMSLLERALIEYSKKQDASFDFLCYRKLILDAGSAITKLTGGDSTL